MQAFDAPAGAAYSAGRSRADVARDHGGIALGRVAGVGGLQGIGGHCGLGSPDPAVGFEAAHPAAGLGAHQPVKGGHGAAVPQDGGVADHHRVAGAVPHHHLEITLGVPAQQLGHPGVVGSRNRHG